MMFVVSFFSYYISYHYGWFHDFCKYYFNVILFHYLFQFYKFLVGGICDLFIESIYQFIILNKLSKVYLVGHSFGAYHAINFAEKYVFYAIID